MPTPTKTTRRRFTVELESTSDVGDFSGFRRWLKVCWRSYSLRVIRLTTVPTLAALPSQEQSDASDARAVGTPPALANSRDD